MYVYIYIHIYIYKYICVCMYNTSIIKRKLKSILIVLHTARIVAPSKFFHGVPSQNFKSHTSPFTVCRLMCRTATCKVKQNHHVPAKMQVKETQLETGKVYIYIQIDIIVKYPSKKIFVQLESDPPLAAWLRLVTPFRRVTSPRFFASGEQLAMEVCKACNKM